MLSKFFLKRPVFAWVIAIAMMAGGILAIYNMSISQYPPIAPPSIAIQAFYPGASAETVENTVTQIIEQKMTGLDDMIYISGTSASSGMARLELTFKAGTDPDLAWAKVQNKLQLAMASLPDAVSRSGVTVSKSTRNYLIIVGLTSPDGSIDNAALNDYAQSNVEKVLARVPGVGEVQAFGAQYAMRVWIDPYKLTSYNLTFEDVVLALRAYNVEVSAGQFGGLPSEPGQRLNASIVVQHLLQTPEEFARIPLRTGTDGATVRISDIGRVEIGAERYDGPAYFNNGPMAGLAIRQSAGANALQTVNAVKAAMDRLKEDFPPGMDVVYPFETTPFTVVAIEEVVKTLLIAILLVFLVMYLFMGNIPRHAHSDHRGAGGDPGHIRGAGTVRLLHQHADHVRHGAGHRPAGRRRHRGRRERRARDDRGRHDRRRGRRTLDGRDHQCPDRHRPGAGCRVHAHGLFPRLDRHHLSAVLGDHRHLHAAVGGGRPDPDPGALRQPAATGNRRPSPLGPGHAAATAVLPLVRPYLLRAA